MPSDPPDSDKKSVRYLSTTDPNQNWFKAGLAPDWLAGFFRMRWLAFIAANATGIAGLLPLVADWRVSVAFAVPAAVAIGLMFYVRLLLVMGCRTDEALHDLLHHARTRLNNVLTSTSMESYLRALDECHKDLCQRIAHYFRARTGNSNIACCIRVMETDDAGKVIFRTAARSDPLSSAREKNSQPIGVDEGIAKAFVEKGNEGAYWIADIREAVKEGVWKMSDNDLKFDDIKFVMVCPINGYFDGAERTLGLLFITTRDGPIQDVFWGAQKGIADSLAMSFAVLYDEKRIKILSESQAQSKI